MENAFGSQAFAFPPVRSWSLSDRTGTATLIEEIRQAVWAVNGNVPIALQRTMQDLYAGSSHERRSRS